MSREEKKLLFRWRLPSVRKVVALLNDSRGWWAEYCELKRKFGMEGELEVVESLAT